MDDIRPVMPPKPPEEVQAPLVEPQPISGEPSGLLPEKKRLPFFKNKKKLGIVGSIVIVVIAAIIVAISWYDSQLSAYAPHSTKLVKVSILKGDTIMDISNILASDKLIKNSTAFDIYTRLSRTQVNLQAGTYRLSPGESVPTIVDHLANGTVDQFSVTFLPGATLADDRTVLINAGYSASEVDTALSASYPEYASTLFANKPAGTTLEGYIYGQTYKFNDGATVTDILNRAFAEFESVVVANDLVSSFSKQGLTLYQGITLASIIQREVSSASDQKQVAQVFYLRLATGLPLGSDVTYIYAAKLLGVTATPTLDSPYNTRINTGLPPGPISVPGLTALQAVAAPASGNYLFFLSGDDGKTYFATTDAEHQANIANYCKIKCSE